MPPNPAGPEIHPRIPAAAMRRLIGSLSIFTMVMTVPQVLTVWVGRQAAGVSLLSWSAYLVSAILWLGYGLRKRDPNIFLPCFGWIAVDSAVIIGVLVNR